MTKLTLQDMASGFNSQTTYNENNTAIEAAVENTLSRDGTTPNEMLSDLDMNSQEITNASAIRTGSLYVNGQLIIANSVDVVGKQVYSATATAGQTLFTGIGAYTQGVAALDVYINGVYQDNTQYAETSTTSITFTTGLSVGDYVVVVSVSDQTIVSLLPTGGTTGQILTKDSATDGDASWQTEVTYNITDNSDTTFLTVDVSENSVFTGTVEATKYYIDDTAAEDGKPSLRLEYDNTTGEYDWMLSRGVQIVAGEYELAVAGNSPAGVFFRGENSLNGLAILAAGNHDSLAAGTVLPKPEDFSPGASVRVTGLNGYIDLITNGTIRARVSDANFQIDDLKVTGNTTLKKVTETKVALSGATPAVDLDTGTVFTHTVAATTTFTFTNPGAVSSFTLIITNGGSQTVNWPASVDWAGGTAPTLTTAGVDVLTFVTPDTGTTWYGFVGGLDMK